MVQSGVHTEDVGDDSYRKVRFRERDGRRQRYLEWKDARMPLFVQLELDLE